MELESSNKRGLGKRPKRLFRVTMVLLALGAFGWWFRRPLFEGNFGVVDPGQVYRSAQPNGHLSEWAQRYHLAAILNLRGGSMAEPFYRQERELADAHGLRFFDVPLSATASPTQEQLLALIAAIREAPFPLLIHCKQGADRTGLGTAVYQMIRLGVPPREALTSFRLEHAHVPVFGPEKLHAPLEKYAAWLEHQGLSHTPARFESWVRYEYSVPGSRPGPAQPGSGDLARESTGDARTRAR